MANLSQLIPALFTGKGGELLTPEQIKRRQDLANSAMAFATDSSPNAGGVASILAKGLAGFRAGYENNKAESGIQAAAKENQSLIANLLSGLGGTGGVGQGATVASPMVAPVQNVAPASIPQSADAGVIRQGLIDRGLPSHVADAFVVNFQDESGLNPGINEAAPLVPGSRGGFGLYQLTGPRRTAYESYAKERGVSPDNVDAQLDWLKYELDGPEAKAAGTILSAPDTATAAQAIVKNFLRPAPEHQQRRSAAYAGLSTQPQQDMGIEGALASSNTSAFPPAPTASGSGINPAIVAALSSPVANAQTQNVAGLLLNQQFSQQEAAQKLALAQAQRQQEIARRQQIAQQNGINPSYALDDELWKGATGNVFAAPSTSTVNGAVINNRTGQTIYEAPAQNFRQITGPEAAAIGLDPAKVYNVGPDGKIAPIGDSGVTVNNNMGGDKFGEEFAKLDANALNTVATSGLSAQRNLGRIDQLEGLLQQSPSGFAGAAALAAGEWGVPTEGLDTLQAAQAAINSLVPEQRQPGSGPMSDADLALFKQSLPRIINQPGGNQTIINTMRGIAQYDAEGANIVQRLRNGELTRAQAFEALQSRPNPLANFKAPAAQAENPLPAQEKKRLKFNPATGVLE